MMHNSARDELAEAIIGYWVSDGDTGFWLGGENAAVIADQLWAAGYRKMENRTITTQEDLDALPVGCVVLDACSDACQKDFDDLWTASRPQLPAAVLWEPMGGGVDE